MVIKEGEFEKIYDDFAPKIFKFCYFRVSSREEAEDIASMVFMRAWDHINTGKDVSNLQGFLFRIATNLVIDYYRNHKERKDISIDDPRTNRDIPDKHDMTEHIDRDLLVEDIRRKIDVLPESYREIIILRYINDLTIGEIAKILETSENNISVRLYRAIDKLKAMV